MKIELVDGKYSCPIEGCDAEYEKLASLRRHCERAHQQSITTKGPPLSSEDQKKRQREYSAKHRLKMAPSKKRKTRSNTTLRPLYDYDDAERMGVYGCRNPILDYRPSIIPEAGNGLFALQELLPGDIVTWYSGTESTTPPEDKTYTIQLNDKYFNGIRVPKKNHGLGSFINCESRDISKTRRNCEFVECDHQKHKCYVEITKKIKAGNELITTYSRGYRKT